MDKQKKTDIILGGVGGAVVSAIIAVLFSMYQDSVRNSEKVEAWEEIIKAKETVMEEIWKAREEERLHLYTALNEAANAQAEAKAALNQARQSTIYIEKLKQKTEGLVRAIEDGSGITANEIAKALEEKVLDTLQMSLPKGAVIAFNLKSCPKNWSEYVPAYGRFIRGIDNSANKIDPDGIRLPGDLQEDQIKSHSHKISTAGVWGRSWTGHDSGPNTAFEKAGDTSSFGGAETRPKNVALLYCEKD